MVLFKGCKNQEKQGANTTAYLLALGRFLGSESDFSRGTYRPFNKIPTRLILEVAYPWGE